MAIVLVTDHPAPTLDIEESVLAPLGMELVVARTGVEEELLALVPPADAILTCFEQVTDAVVGAAPNLRVISRYGVGVDNIAVDAASARGIPVTNVPIYCIDEVAEHSLALLLALIRRITTYDRSVRSGQWDLDVGTPIRRLAGSTLGVVGFGNIGRAVAHRALGLGLTVLISDRSATQEEVRAAGGRLVELDELLAESDGVTLHVPLTESTRHLIDADSLALMKPSAVLINCARGAVVDLDALTDAITAGQLAGAGIDVFEPEKLPGDHPLREMGNVVLTPHVAFYSEDAIADLQKQAVENVASVLRGRFPAHVVNRSAIAKS